MSLYDQNWRYTDDGQQLDHKVNDVLRPIFDDFILKGYSPREIAHLLNGVVIQLELENVLDKEQT